MNTNKNPDKIYTTTDYTFFSLINGNRKIDLKDRSDLINAIEKAGINIAPVILSKDNKILDGQNRLEICMLLGFPIRYCYLPKTNNMTDMETILSLNTSAKVWNIYAYLNAGMHSKDKEIVENYTELHRLCNHTLLKINIGTLLSLCGHNKDQIKAQKQINIPENIEYLIGVMNTFSKLYYQKVGKTFHVDIIAKTLFNIECDLQNQTEQGNENVKNIWDYDLMLSKVLVKIPDIGFDHTASVLKNLFRDSFNASRTKNRVSLT